MSLLTHGLEKDLNTPSSSSRNSRVAALMALPLSTWRDQRLGPTFADPLPQAGPAYEISGDLGLFPFGHIPGHHFAAPDVDHQIELEPDTTDAGGQIDDVPTAYLIWGSGLHPRNRTGCAGRTGTTTTVDLAVGIEDPGRKCAPSRYKDRDRQGSARSAPAAVLRIPVRCR